MDADVVIVGAGAAGATLASRLSVDPERSVLLVEAGPEIPPGASANLLTTVSFAATGADWELRAQVTPRRDLDYPQGKCVGGGSSVNGALALRGAPEDFDRWAASGCPSWAWSEMLPAFRRLETDLDYGTTSRLHGDDGPVPIVRWHDDELVDLQVAFRSGCMAQGMPWVDDHNDPESTGVGSFPMNRSGGRRMSTALTYLEGARHRLNLSVWSGTRVLRVETEDGSATGVTLERNGQLQTVRAREVVVSAGSIQTPALLWRSGLGPADRLRALGIDPVVDLPAVGANLHDHPGVFYFLAPGERRVPFSDPQYQLGARYTSRWIGGRERHVPLDDELLGPEWLTRLPGPAGRSLRRGADVRRAPAPLPRRRLTRFGRRRRRPPSLAQPPRRARGRVPSGRRDAALRGAGRPRGDSGVRR